MTAPITMRHDSAAQVPRTLLPALVVVVLLAGGFIYAGHVKYQQMAGVAFVSTLPWIFLILRTDLQPRVLPFLPFLGLLYVMALCSLSWLRDISFQSWLIGPLFYLPGFLPMFYLLRWMRRSWPNIPLVFLWPLVFTSTEWIRIHYSPGEIGLCQLGASLIPFHKLIQVVDLTGLAGLSFLASASAGLIGDVILVVADGSHIKVHRKLLLQAIALACLFAIVLLYGASRDRPDTFSVGPTVDLIQPNAPGWHNQGEADARLSSLIDLTRRHSRPGTADLIIWPENSVLRHTGLPGAAHAMVPMQVADLSKELNTPILFDGPLSIDEARELHYTTLINLFKDGTPLSDRQSTKISQTRNPS